MDASPCEGTFTTAFEMNSFSLTSSAFSVSILSVCQWIENDLPAVGTLV